MTVLYVILGVIMVIGGFVCMASPVATLLYTGYYIGILMLVYGVLGIIRCAKYKGDVLDWVMNILALIVGIFALIRPGSTLVFDALMIFALAAYLVIQGVVHIVLAFKSKKVNSKWFWMLLVGIVSLVMGIYLFINKDVAAATVGMLIGICFIEAGISTITMALAIHDVKGRIKDIFH